MTNYWWIRAGVSGELWNIWKNEELISVGWDIGEITHLSSEVIKEKINEHPDYNQKPGTVASILQRFVGHSESPEKMMIGDTVIILGPGVIINIAKIGEYQYRSNGLDGFPGHTYLRKVKFENIGPIRLGDIPNEYQQRGKFAIHLVGTLAKYNIDKHNFDELIKEISKIKPIDEFILRFEFTEIDIQNYILRNFQDLDKNIIKVEKEYRMKTGPPGFVDFVGYDKNENIYVIEVKIGKANDNAIGQIIGYMAAISEEKGKKTIGILVAESFSERTKYTAKSMEIKLIEFRIKPVFQYIEYNKE